ncbi:NAD(P)H-dependent oxidoreductase [Salipaludibacillus agaradhaerens]|uniref:FMN dependent NADH:quinone oxidoreductase n=1 Tax=Salipaludibacillus agaradhaerens TaxID=76935 RepID=A0A9Q4G155_SALAG|nr:NAD(P)H-dependent oxidoreductase [Salipaludibacillus agaradhaerens]MCR6098687.1 NAD(P)H-dependent oxidoreductase [Salipaludibacillus agaradhaerens]MCR6115694.1 NAD(P)H-dependent oxidoreductase [Salipaludibacillus agaradhaerens]
MTLLYVTANPKRVEDSYSLQLGKCFLDVFRKNCSDTDITQLDLFAVNIPPLEKEALAAWERFESIDRDIPITNPFVEQFLQAEIVVFVTPLWNMSSPPQVKAYIDQLIIPKKTFCFTEEGIKGLAHDKTIVHIQSCGGVYSEGPLASLEHGNTYLQTIFSLIGVKNYHHVSIEGTSTFPQEVEERFEKAKEETRQLAKTLSDRRRAN